MQGGSRKGTSVLCRLNSVFESRVVDVALPVICTLVYLSFALSLSAYETPDEPLREALSLFILQNGTLPLGPEPSIVNPIWGFSYAYTAYGPSLVAVPFLAIASLFTHDLVVLTIVVRLVNVLCGGICVWVSLRIGRRLFDSSVYAVLLAVFVGFTPQFAFMSSYLNNDVPSALACAVIILAWVRGLQDGWDVKTCALLGLGIGLCAITYYFGFGFIVLSIVVYGVSAFRAHAREQASAKRLLALALLVFAVAMLVGGWYYVRNAFIYQGDIFGFGPRNELAEACAQVGFKPSDHVTPRNLGWSVGQMLFEPWGEIIWWKWTFYSFFGLFGYMKHMLPNAMYGAYGVVVLLAILGVAGSKTIAVRGRLLLPLALVASVLFAVAFAVYYSWSADYEPQGRYLYSAFVPVMIFAVCGVRLASRGLSWLVRAVSSRWAHRAAEGVDAIVRVALPLVVAVLYVVLFALAVHVGLSHCLLGADFNADLAPFTQGF